MLSDNLVLTDQRIIISGKHSKIVDIVLKVIAA